MEYLNTFNLNEKVALITGGGGILGKKFAQGLVSAGASVAIVEIDEKTAQDAVLEVGGNTAAFVCDVSDAESVKDCVLSVKDHFGSIDILINNAATKTSNPRDFFTPFEYYSLELWREVMSVNIDGMFLMAQAVGNEMLKQGGGSIVQIASIYGVMAPDPRIYEGSNYLGGPINTPAVYAASKAAVVGLTQWLSVHWAKNGIRVNCLAPGGVTSGQNSVFTEKYSNRIPMGRMATSDEMVPTLLYLSSEASSYITGQVIMVDGGLSVW